MTAAERDRAIAAFRGLAIGDALGMPTQSMSADEIAADYGRITGFVDAGPHQRIAAGMPAGSVTDDTEQAVLLAELLIDGDGRVDADTFARALLAWENRMRARGSLDLLGPSTKAALDRLTRGVPAAEAGRFGTTNGAAMRITPLGIAMGADDLDAFVDAVARTSVATHNTGLGIAGASAVGAAVSAGVAGADTDEAVRLGIAAAALGARRGHWVAGADIAARLRWSIPMLAALAEDRRAEALVQLVGTSVASQESVVAAMTIAALADNAWEALCLAASLGGDTDTIAAMAGAVLGATRGAAAWPEAAVATVERVNDLALPALVDGLLRIRSRGGDAQGASDD